MKNKLLFILMLLLSVFQFSCKRHEVFGDIEPNTTRVMAEFTDVANGSYVTRDFSTQAVTIDLTELRLSPRTVTNHDTKVRVIVNPVVLSAYNSANGTSYTSAPPSGFSLAQSEYVLGPEQRSTFIKGTILPSALVDGQYAVGLSIASMSDGDISATAHNVIVFLSVKNAYDGVYNVKGYASIPSSTYTGFFSLSCNEDFEVATSGASSVFLSPAQPVANNGSFVYINNLLPDIVFDKTTNKVSAVSARNGSLGTLYPFDATYNSRYDPNSKTIYIKYGIEPVGSGRYVIDTLTFCRPR